MGRRIIFLSQIKTNSFSTALKYERITQTQNCPMARMAITIVTKNRIEAK